MIEEKAINNIDSAIKSMISIGMDAQEMVRFFKMSIAEIMLERYESPTFVTKKMKLKSRRTFYNWLYGIKQ